MRRLRCALWAAWHVALYRLRRREPVFGTPPEPPEPEIPHHFCLDVSPAMHAELLRLVAAAPKTGITTALKEALELAHRIDLPFTPPVDWTALEKRAMLGYDVVDQIWDAKRKGDAA